MSASITIDVSGLDEAFLRLKPIFEFEPSELMTDIAGIGEAQTRRRITDEKTAPDGTPWQPNTQGTSILMESGQNLLSIGVVTGPLIGSQKGPLPLVASGQRA